MPKRSFFFLICPLFFPAAIFADDVTIYRDLYGVPHIFAETDTAATFAHGYTQAEDHLETMMIMYYGAFGTSTYHLGPTTLNIGTDIAMRMFYVPDVAIARYNDLQPEIRALLESFSDGVNYYIATHRATIPAWIEPITPQMVVALGRGLTYGNQLITLMGKAPPGTFPVDLGDLSASNQWALSPNRITTGNAVVQADPHLLWEYPRVWYEFQTESPSFHVAGACFFGLPALIMGHNRHVGWSMTDDEVDNADLFLLPVDKNDPTHYLYGGQSLPFDVNFIIIPAQNGGGLPLYRVRTVVGPVISPMDYVSPPDFSDANFVMVAKATMSEEIGSMDQFLKMNTARSIGELKSAMNSLQLDKWNIVAADIQGTIFYVQNSRHPDRDLNLAYAEPINVPEDKPWLVWDSVIPLSGLPQMLNPPKGFLMNTNTPPWMCNPHEGMTEDSYAPHVFGIKDMNDRGTRALQLLDNNTVFTPDEARQLSLDTHVVSADRLVPALRLNYDAYQADFNAAQQQIVGEVIDVLEAWDRSSEATSQGMALWQALREYNSRWARNGTVYDFNVPMETDDGQRLFSDLKKAGRRCLSRFGRLDPAWGDIHGIVRGGEWMPTNGAGSSQSLRIKYGDYNATTHRYEVNWGSSYMMFMEMSDPPKAYSMKPLGENEDPASPHYNDLTRLYARDEYKPFLYDINAITAHPYTVTELQFPAPMLTPTPTPTETPEATYTLVPTSTQTPVPTESPTSTPACQPNPLVFLAGWMDTSLSIRGGVVTFLAYGQDLACGEPLAGAWLVAGGAQAPLTADPGAVGVFRLDPILVDGPLKPGRFLVGCEVEAGGAMSATWPYLTVR